MVFEIQVLIKVDAQVFNSWYLIRILYPAKFKNFAIVIFPLVIIVNEDSMMRFSYGIVMCDKKIFCLSGCSESLFSLK